MIIKLENYHSFFRENKNYNEDTKNFVTELFETNSTGRIKYKLSEVDNFNSTKRHQYFSNIQGKKEYLKPQDDEYYVKSYSKYEGLGPLEFSLASYLLNSNMEYDVYVLTGALGSGKSSLCDYTLNFIRNSNLKDTDPLFFPKDGLVHRINFNEHFSSEKKDEIVDEFKLLLIAKLTSLIENIHQSELFINAFIDKIAEKDNERYELFSDFVRELTAASKTTEEQKFDFLLTWLNSFNSSLSYKLRLISYLLAFVKENKKNKTKVDFIILFDNIDRLNDDAQIEILNIIFSFSVKLNIKILVPMRLTTFGKIKGNGSYSFAILQNTGQPPISIFAERIKHFLKNKEEYSIENKISRQYISYLNNKIDFIIEQLSDNSNLNRLTNFFTSISGNSIRRGLFLSERFFLNSAYSFQDETFYQDEFLKALLVANSETGKMANNDRLVNNLFASADNTNTLLKIRILQILNYFKESDWPCKINLLISQISFFEEYSNDEILSSINDLIFYTRRLIYIEGVKEYSDYNNLAQSMNDVVHITYSGVEYLNTLLYNTVYLQNSFITINWKIPNSFKNITYLKSSIDKISEQNKSSEILYLKNVIKNRKATITDFIPQVYDYKEPKERMKLVRECLYFLMINDLNQICIYYENNNIHNVEAVEDRYIKNSIIIEIIAKTSISVMNILRSYNINVSEIENWYNLLLVCDVWNRTIFKDSSKSIDNAINYYEYEFKK